MPDPLAGQGGPRHAGALLASLLAEHGVRHVFGVPGGQTLALYDGILDYEPGLRHIAVRDERTAAYAADAYARVSGQAGVCDATVGPGAAKLPSGLAEALGASVPVIALVSDLPARLAPHRYRGAASQALDQQALLAPVTKWQASVPDAATMPALVRQAFREATTGRPGPVALFLPQDVLDGPAGGETGAGWQAVSERFGRFPAFRPAPDPADIEAVAAVLRQARRPFILAGGGVLHSGAGAELTALAQALSAAVGTTLTGKGSIAEDHPLSVGVTGTMGTAAATEAFAEADTVLLVGTKASSGATYSWSLPRADQRVVQCDIDPCELGRAFPLVAAVLADARLGLAALAAALAGADVGEPGGTGAGVDAARADWRARIIELASGWRAGRDSERASTEQPIAPQRVVAEVEALLAPGDTLVCDASLASGWGGVYLEQRSPGRRVLTPRGQAGLGYAVPAAIGVAHARPDQRVVVLTGDGALAYAVGEFATIAEQRLPVTVVVLNNRTWGWIRWYRRIHFGRAWQDDDFDDVAFADVAAGFRWAGERVSEPGRLGAALRAALDQGGPALVDVVTGAWQTPIAAHRRAITDPSATAGYGG